jgi:hypothetical protein
MGTKHGPKNTELDSDPYDDYEDYEDELGDDLGNIKHLSKDFYSTDWEDPRGSGKKFSARRRIERRNDFKALFSQFDDWYDESDWDRDF